MLRASLIITLIALLLAPEVCGLREALPNEIINGIYGYHRDVVIFEPIGEYRPLNKTINHPIVINNGTFFAPANFSELTFNDIVVFNDVVFRKGVNFSQANFNSLVIFNNISFKNDAKDICDFRKTRFNGTVLFRRILFPNPANFTGAKFLGTGHTPTTSIYPPNILDHDYNCTKGVIVTQPAGSVSFKEVTFNDAAIFKYTIFQADACFDDIYSKGVTLFNGTDFASAAYFENSIFEVGAIFEDALLGKSTDFINVNFKDDVSFKETYFRGIANFKGCSFEKDANFAGVLFGADASFEDLTVTERPNFKGAHFRDKASLNSTRFLGGADLCDIYFEGDAQFINTAFNNNISFIDSEFRKNAQFKGAKFDGDVYFDNAVFRGDVDFTDATFAMDHNLSLRGTEFDLLKEPEEAAIKTFIFDEAAYSTLMNLYRATETAEGPGILNDYHNDEDIPVPLNQPTLFTSINRVISGLSSSSRFEQFIEVILFALFLTAIAGNVMK